MKKIYVLLAFLLKGTFMKAQDIAMYFETSAKTALNVFKAFD